jgi:GNAT superfamily N-acetyltransferase
MINLDPILLKRSQRKEASKILVEAFHEDPMFCYLGQKSKVNANALQYFCELSLRNSQVYKFTCANTNELKGMAAWIPPGKSEMTNLQILSMFFVLPWKCGWHKLGKCLSLFSTLDKHHQEEMIQPHWTLNLIGVVPAYQGQGIGSLLLQPVLEQADQENLPCYLSTFTLQAVYFYQKHDFEILWQGKLSDDSPDIWTMKRKSQA